MTDATDARRIAATGAVWLDRSDRVRLDVAGPDRAKFLHNLTTNDVKRLSPGHGAESFVTSPQGKTLGFVTLLAGEDRILLLTDPGGAEHLAPHLAKYGVFDEVAITDICTQTFEYHVCGEHAEEALRQANVTTPEAGDLRHALASVDGRRVRVVRESPFGFPGLTIIGDRADAVAVALALVAGGAVAIEAEAAEPLRIEAGTPRFGRDVTTDNLPQEVGRDVRAINFVKGCYLGQETVARIDSMGHVNRHLRGLVLSGGPADLPPPGAVIEAAGKGVGAITSAAYSPWRECPVALGYVRSAQAVEGTLVEVLAGGRSWSAVVSDLPMKARTAH